MGIAVIRQYWDAQCTQAEMGFTVTEAVLGCSMYSGRNGFSSHCKAVLSSSILRQKWVSQSLRQYWVAQYTQAEMGFTVTENVLRCSMHSGIIGFSSH